MSTRVKRQFVVDESGGPLPQVWVRGDEGREAKLKRSMAAEEQQQLIAANCEHLVAQGRIGRADVPLVQRMFEQNYEATIDAMLALPTRPERALSDAYLAATGVTPVERPLLADADSAYAHYAAATAVAAPGELPPSVRGFR